jgi:hypothetical protein
VQCPENPGIYSRVYVKVYVWNWSALERLIKGRAHVETLKIEREREREWSRCPYFERVSTSPFIYIVVAVRYLSLSCPAIRNSRDA